MTRSAPKRWIVIALPLLLSACATMAPPLPPSLDLPTPPTDLKAQRKGDRVMLSWTLPDKTTDRQTIRALGPTTICRSAGTLKECTSPVGQTPAQAVPATNSSKQKPQGNYVDVLPASMQSDSPGAFVTYAIEVQNKSGRGAGLSSRVRASAAHTLPPPPDFKAQVIAQGVSLTWSAVSAAQPEPSVHYVYRIYRSAETATDRVLVGEIPLGEGGALSLTDTSLEWEKTYDYRAETVTVIDDGHFKAEVEGDDTPAAKVFADDVFPPAVPSGLQAVFSGPGQKPFIDLIWAPVTDPDLAGYNVYRHEAGSQSVKVNNELVVSPSYRDATVQAGKSYSYSVSAVDLRGNESAKSEEASESVP